MPSLHHDIAHLLDTNVLSELLKPEPDAGVAAWAVGVLKTGIGVVTVEEVRYGLSWKPNERMAEWFEAFLRRGCVVLPVTEEIARCAGDLRGSLRRKGRTRSQADMLIAATASVHGLTVVSRNASDFEGCGIAVLNPFA